MNSRFWLKKLLILFLELRMLVLIGACVLLSFFCSFLLNIIFQSVNFTYLIYGVFKKSGIISNVARNCFLLLDGKFDLFAEAGLKIALFLFLVVLLRALFRLKNSLRVAAPFLIFLGAFFYCFWLMNFSLQVSGAIASAIFILYVVDFIVYEQNKIFDSARSMNVFACFFVLVPFLSEIFFTPIYLKFISIWKNNKPIDRKYFFLRNLHFFLLSFIVFLVLPPFKSSKIKEAVLLKKGNFYGMAISQKAEKLFFANDGQGQLESYPLGKDAVESDVVYRVFSYDGDQYAIGEFIKVNDARGELYFTDRAKKRLLAIDIYDYSIKKQFSSQLFDKGDNFLDCDKDTVFGITEDSFCVYRINLDSAENALTFRCIDIGEGSGISCDESGNMLFVSNWNNPAYEYFLFKLDPHDFHIIGKIKFLHPVFVLVSNGGQNVYCWNIGSSLDTYVNIYDSKTLKLLDRIRTIAGAKYMALDDERQLLFVGNITNNLIQMIDLKTKNTVMFRAGDFSLRAVALDTKRRNFFVTTKEQGIFKGSY